MNGILEEIAELMYEAALISREVADSLAVEIQPIQSDGSCRRFFRVGLDGKGLCLAVAPATTAGNDLLEATSAGAIGLHLSRLNIPVPAIHGWRRPSGLILFEDLGDTRLFDLQGQVPTATLLSYYKQTIDWLITMQWEGVRGFDTAWCWDTPRYDQELMIVRESRYFLQAFWADLLHHDIPDGIDEEFAEIAATADTGCPDVFLHRDFQSRNIMIKDGAVRFIDYQGGRLGAPGYDLASLLIDPYAALPGDVQAELLQYYQQSLQPRYSIDSGAFRQQYAFLALQRNLQILGAFSFLSRVRQKVFFRQYIGPSLRMLHDRLQDPLFASFPILRRIVGIARSETGAL
jgi:aminoglycoside/choline kinase family phosphotransferase